jgi:hypothetical protein
MDVFVSKVLEENRALAACITYELEVNSLTVNVEP